MHPFDRVEGLVDVSETALRQTSFNPVFPQALPDPQLRESGCFFC
jgi:hypothetical protein